MDYTKEIKSASPQGLSSSRGTSLTEKPENASLHAFGASAAYLGTLVPDILGEVGPHHRYISLQMQLPHKLRPLACAQCVA